MCNCLSFDIQISSNAKCRKWCHLLAWLSTKFVSNSNSVSSIFFLLCALSQVHGTVFIFLLSSCSLSPKPNLSCLPFIVYPTTRPFYCLVLHPAHQPLSIYIELRGFVLGFNLICFRSCLCYLTAHCVFQLIILYWYEKKTRVANKTKQ